MNNIMNADGFKPGLLRTVRVKTSEQLMDNDPLTNSGWLSWALSMDNAGPMRVKSSHQARCRCCGDLKYEYHILEPVKEDLK